MIDQLTRPQYPKTNRKQNANNSSVCYPYWGCPARGDDRPKCPSHGNNCATPCMLWCRGLYIAHRTSFRVGQRELVCCFLHTQGGEIAIKIQLAGNPGTLIKNMHTSFCGTLPCSLMSLQSVRKTIMILEVGMLSSDLHHTIYVESEISDGMNSGILANVEDRSVPGFVPKISTSNRFFSLDDARAKKCRWFTFKQTNYYII